MDDPHFDHKSAKRFDRQRASGPFGVDEILPKKILTWVNRKHPDSGKKQMLLNFSEWKRGLEYVSTGKHKGKQNK